MGEIREALEKLRKPFDKKYNDALDRVLLFLPPFEVLEAHIEGLGLDIEGLEQRIEDIEDYRDAKEELRDYKPGRGRDEHSIEPEG